MVFRILSFCSVLLFFSATLSAQAAQSEVLRQFGLEDGLEAIGSNSAFYVPAKQLKMTDEVRYADGVGSFTAATAFTHGSRSVSIQARFNRASGNVETIVGENIVAISGTVFPRVEFASGHEFLYHELTGRKENPRYMLLMSEDADVQYKLLTAYHPETAQADLSRQGIATGVSQPVSYRIDSTYALTGLQPEAVLVPARRKVLAKAMSSCQATALNRMDARYGRSLEYLQELTATLEKRCPLP